MSRAVLSTTMSAKKEDTSSLLIKRKSESQDEAEETHRRKKHKPTATLVDAGTAQSNGASDAVNSSDRRRSRSRSHEKEWKPETPKRSKSVEYL